MASDDLVASERSPLLSPAHHPEIPDGLSPQPAHSRRRGPRPTATIILLLLYLIFLDLSVELIAPAQTRVFEQIYCRQYYEEHDSELIGSDGRSGVDEKYCKVSRVQGDVATLRGWQSSLDSIGMLIFSIPWGYASDLYGRKPVLLLVTLSLLVKHAYVQSICYLGKSVSLKWTWMSAAYSLFGGGITVCTALIYTIISDVITDGKRVAIFFQVMAAQITTQFLGSLASGALMAWNPWIPMVLGLFVKLISIFILLFIPETLKRSHSPISHEYAVIDRGPPRPKTSAWWERLRSAFTRFRNALPLVTSHIKLLLVVAAFSVHMLLLNHEVLRQYISSRYEQTLAHATLLISVRSGLIVLIAIFILPVISGYCRNRLGANRSDMLLARVSTAFLALSFLAVGLAPTQVLVVAALAVNALGWGLFSFLRSLAATLVEAHQLTRLNSFIGLVDIVGTAVGGPLLAALFSKGVEFRGTWFGLPFFLCSGVLTILLLGLMSVSV